ncbi:ribonucleoside-diphosphate reductase large subunit [Phaeocystis globosa virus]|uniref:Ribonucleoside-diphosphate reductase large subunit n=1 Tax=Phaeocystis globosa virus PgV-16T TaxID=3071227 RepID=A0AC59EWV1_9VIRU|nr:ribonucleotide reductase [Phaeocystis globosa virus]AGM15439.1 ribonucleoside-diphosphate reductase large subunit [Phaeocystis globosa virus PgV-16T]UYE94169.1 ribonucleoside-diphosphate reductase large subunit [Phaeocystis globosa virus]
MACKSNVIDMHVIKRSGKKEVISFDKILKRIKKTGKGLNLQNVIYASLSMKVIDQLKDDISTTDIDELTAQQCASMASKHPDYTKLASAITVSNLHKNTDASFYKTVKKLYDFSDINDNKYKLIHDDVMATVEKYQVELDEMIDYNRDFLFDYFGFKTLERAYLLRIDGVIVERPQHMWMRVSICIHGSNLEKIKETYDYMSNKYFIHATPTLFNAGTPRPQLSSCYLLSMEDDSIEGIFNTVKECAQISKWSGGIGLHIHNVRSSGSHIRGTNGTSNGIIPMLGVFNKTARYVDQGGKRNGSFAMYLEPHHPDIEEFLELRKNHGDEESKARDLFYAIWASDVFMERVIGNKIWSLFCPDKCPGLSDCYGEDYRTLYMKYESEGRYNKQINARDLWLKILDAQMETGTPYILYKDACNSKSNQKNLGTIKSSNLCCEIVEYSDDKETAVCNLASIGLGMFVNEDKTFDYVKLADVTKVLVTNLNNIIDVNFYPNKKTSRSNYRHRPVGIGVQGLADTFFKMDIAFTSEEAKTVNKYIFETIYFAALEKSNDISRERGEGMEYLKTEYVAKKWSFTDQEPDCRTYVISDETDVKLAAQLKECKPIKSEIDDLNAGLMGAYSSFIGSPISNGQFQFDLWNEKPCSDRYDWDTLRAKIVKHGIRNSLLCAPMPTASTSQILGNNECFEPITSNIYSRKTLAGEFTMVNKYLVDELLALKLWDESVKNNIIANKGSVQYIDGLPEHIKEKYKIVWEIKMKTLIDMARDRGLYICQSQSMNLWMEDPEPKSLTNMHFYGWRAGLKTGIYYLRRKPKHHAQQFTIEPEKKGTLEKIEEAPDDGCLMCSG